MAAPAAAAVWGRSREREALEGALAGVRSGHSEAWVIRGEAGVGKTTLLGCVAAQATDCRVLRIAGIESEAELTFAALHQLCAPLLDDIGALPEPQASALRVAFGLAAGEPPDRFLVGLGVLSLLSEGAGERPLVCLIDDAQWLDQASLQVLGVAARRLGAESVLVLFGVRESGEARLLPGLPDLTVEGLDQEDARVLLSAAIPGPLDEDVRDRLIAETHGNPLALLELVRGTSEAELAGGFGLPASMTVPGQLEGRYLQRVKSLPDTTQRLMVLAAADPTGDPTLLWRAAQTLGLTHDVGVPAERERLLELGPTVRFPHPLVRSAAYAAGSPDDRRAAHLALADATDSKTDPDRAVWHRAAAATGPDEEVAAELEGSAHRAEARGGLAASGAFLQRAVALTPDPAKRAGRALAAAHAQLHAGAFDASMALLAEAEADAASDLQQARVEQLRGEVNRAATSGSRASALLLGAARRLEPLDPRLARETCLDAWGAALVAGRLAEPGAGLVEVSAVARGMASHVTEPRPGDLLLDGLAAVIQASPAEAWPSLRRAVDAFAGHEVSTDAWLHWGAIASNASLALWDIDSWVRLSARHVEVARAAGALSPLAQALNVRRVVAIWCGDFSAASSLGVEEQVVKEVTGARRASYGGLFLAAYRGDAAAASPLIAAATAEAHSRGEGLGLQITDRATALLRLGLGHYADALTAAERAADGNLGPFTWQALPDLVEAAVRAGKPDLATEGLERLHRATADAGSAWGDGLAARCRALLAEGASAEQAYLEAVDRLGRTPLVLELARSQLLFGEWLRREGRRSDAREQLRDAYTAFAEAGAEAFAERARHELLATGEKVRQRQVDTLDELTPQEEHIARMARDGRSNPEIAAELFISPRTVEWHLRKVFGKLGITSRKGLQDALPARPRAGTSG